MNEQRRTIQPEPASPQRGGFTLVEIMIAMAVAGVLGAAILSLVLGQNRFYGQSDDTIYAQQSLRAAMDMIASELRMAGPGDVIAAEDDEVAVRFDLHRAVVCDTLLASGEAYVFVYDWVDNANVPADYRGTAISSPYESDWDYSTTSNWVGSSEAYGAAKSPCIDAGAPDTGATKDYRRVKGWTTEFGYIPPPGTLIRQYGKLTYKLAPSNFTDGLAIWRNGQELVSPFENGAAFSYELDNGTIVSSVPLSDLLNGVVKVETVKLDVTAVGDGPNRFDVRRSIQYDIPLRN